LPWAPLDPAAPADERNSSPAGVHPPHPSKARRSLRKRDQVADARRGPCRVAAVWSERPPMHLTKGPDATVSWMRSNAAQARQRSMSTHSCRSGHRTESKQIGSLSMRRSSLACGDGASWELRIAVGSCSKRSRGAAALFRGAATARGTRKENAPRASCCRRQRCGCKSPACDRLRPLGSIKARLSDMATSPRQRPLTVVGRGRAAPAIASSAAKVCGFSLTRSAATR
jgi:hypothetical protein